MAEYYVEDFVEGFEIITPERTITDDEIIVFGAAYDPQDFHLDKEAAQASVFKGLVASGYQVASLSWTLGYASGAFDVCSLAGLGIEDLRWKAPLRAGDTVHCKIRSLGWRESKSHPGAGIARFSYQMINQHNDVIMTLIIVQLFRKRPVKMPAADPDMLN